MNHRIVPDGTAIVTTFPSMPCYYAESDTVPLPSPWTAEQLTALAKIPLEEWDEINVIHRKEYRNCVDYPFSQYLSGLLTLAPLKGLTTEQVKELKP